MTCNAGLVNPRIITPSERVAHANTSSVTPILNFPLIYSRRLEELQKRLGNSENSTDKKLNDYVSTISEKYAKTSVVLRGIKRKLAKLERKYKKIKVSNLDLQKKLEAIEKTFNYVLKKSLSGSSTKSSQL